MKNIGAQLYYTVCHRVFESNGQRVQIKGRRSKIQKVF